MPDGTFDGSLVLLVKPAPVATATLDPGFVLLVKTAPELPQGQSAWLDPGLLLLMEHPVSGAAPLQTGSLDPGLLGILLGGPRHPVPAAGPSYIDPGFVLLLHAHAPVVTPPPPAPAPSGAVGGGLITQGLGASMFISQGLGAGGGKVTRIIATVGDSLLILVDVEPL